MYEKRSKNVYGKFETASLGDTGGSIANVKDGSERAPIQVSKWIVFALAASSSFITTLDGSIVNIGLPAISQTFHVGVSGAIEWVIIGYLVIIAAVLLTFGRLADIVGRRPILLTGLGVFMVGSALCGMAPTLLTLIIARLFQGLGGALIFSVNTTLPNWCMTLLPVCSAPS